MLILSRHEGEEIAIGADVVVVVHKIRGGVVHVGIKAPPSVPIYRGEILSRARRQETPPTNEKATHA